MNEVMNSEKIALFDMDGTICDYVGSMNLELEKLRAPNEPIVDPFMVGDAPEYQYLWDRMELIKSDEKWWANLPKYQLGFDIFKLTKELGYHNEILTQAPKKNPAALAGKLQWIINNIDGEIEFTMTRNKSRHYGKILVDDYPGYIIPWLKHRPRGLVVMPLNEYNKGFTHENVVVYDGSNIDEVKEIILERIG